MGPTTDTSNTVLVTTPMFGRYSAEARTLLRENDCEFVELSREEAADRDVLYDHLADVDAWVVGYTTIDADTLDHAPRLEVVAKHGAGVDNVDLDAARERGVAVTNAPGANANAVAELVVLHMLNFCRDLVGADRAVRERRWEGDIGSEISGKTLGIVGLGAIGRTLVERTTGFDLEYLAHDVEERPDFQARHSVTFHEELSELLAGSDFVTVHVPLTDGTRHLFGAAEFEVMKPGASLINTSRGGVVEEAALLEALDRGDLGGAALDVLEEEPPGGSPHYDDLLRSDEIAFSPHIGGKTEEAMGAISDATARNVLSVFEGTEPPHRIV